MFLALGGSSSLPCILVRLQGQPATHTQGGAPWGRAVLPHPASETCGSPWGVICFPSLALGDTPALGVYSCCDHPPTTLLVFPAAALPC